MEDRKAKQETRLDPSCITLGVAATLGALAWRGIVIPAACILALAAAAGLGMAVPGLPIYLIARSLGRDILDAAIIAGVGAVLTVAMTIILAEPLSDAVRDTWKNTGRSYALRCQQRKNQRRNITAPGGTE